MFLKQIAKLKHYTGSSRSINSANSSNNDLTGSQQFNTYQHTSSVNSINRHISHDSKSRVPKAFANLFKTRSNTSLSEINKVSSLTSKAASVASSTNKLNSLNLFRQYSINDEMEVTSLNNMTQVVSNLNKTNLVFDEISDMLNKSTGRKVILDDEFRENLNLIVQQSELMKKHQTDKVRFICKFFTFLFFLFMFVFFMLFLYELHSIGSKLLNQSYTNASIPI